MHKKYEAAKLAEVAGSLQLVLLGPKWYTSTYVLTQQNSADRAKKEISAQKKAPPESMEVHLPLGKVPTCGRTKTSPELVCSYM